MLKYSYSLFILLFASFLFGQTDSLMMKSSSYSALKFRNVGPAITSGRIADIVIHPENNNMMYVAVGSGNVWKTENAGTTWTPIFEKEGSYSIGCITLDPNNDKTLWVGTGENVGGRHVGFGDGIYKSTDGGNSWKNMGLKKSEHISRIIVHPENSDVIMVAVQGPLWSKGGERGFYKSTDGGDTWKHTLGDQEWTGVTEIVMDPTHPEIIYAATWQRHRTVAAYMGGGPLSSIWKSTDGGDTWTKIDKGLPSSNLGKTGLAISPFNNEVIYAAIETDRKTGGFYISRDGGASWTRQSDMVSGGTGPHYYQELYADPHQEGRLYLMNNTVLITNDHGKTYERMNEENKHVDSHAIAWRDNDPNYVLIGTDGGLYESFDKTKTWRYTRNLPLTQYYKVAVDDAEPFYNIYGGTQDNGSHGGPSRTMYEDGIRNRHWRVVLGADGHQSATEPGNPNITYGEFQEGFLWRIDHKTGEQVYIRPEAGPNEPYERFNWDAPILVSAHDPKRIYFASQRVWRSDNRGDDWTALSGDITKNQNRFELPIMGKKQSWDNAWDVDAMSNYNTITSLGESPKNENILYAGTDDGIIQVTADSGDSWRKVEFSRLPGLPSTAFTNDIRADLFDENVVYAAFDNHKYGDFKPYLMKSTDKGNTWRKITGDLPDRLLVWRIVQDHVDPDLLFIATEFGIYFTNNGGTNWIKMNGGLPTISFRDITIQRRENDLVAASFGRGFYVLDDYTALRNVDKKSLADEEGHLYNTRPALWYAQKQGMYAQGDNDYKAPNPDYGATFTYFLKSGLTDSQKKKRTDAEKKLAKANQDVPFPGWDALDEEVIEEKNGIYLVIKDMSGKIINKVKGSATKGLNRKSWNLQLASDDPIKLDSKPQQRSFFGGGGYKVTPGTYTVSLVKVDSGSETLLDGPNEFEVKPLMEPTIKGASYEEIVSFRNDFQEFKNDLAEANAKLSKVKKYSSALMKAYERADEQPVSLLEDIYAFRSDVNALDKKMNGSKSRAEVGEKNDPVPGNANLLGWVTLGGTYGPTGNHIKAFNRAKNQLTTLATELDAINARVSTLKTQLKAAGAPLIQE